jgi:hypothetical protein
MPPEVTPDQAEKALAKGTPNRKEIALTIASDKVRKLVQLSETFEEEFERGLLVLNGFIA